jgi:hypothetical protein
MDRVKTKLLNVKNKGAYIYLPLKLVQDSAFPFSTGQVLVVRISGNKLVIE